MKLDQYALGNGSKIAWAEYGDPSGSPVLLLHGLVGSILSEGMEEQLQELPLRVIAIARPGYGLSDYFHMECVADWGQQLEAFLNFLGLYTFDIYAISAGAPYGYALAALYPEMVSAVYVNSGLPAVYLPDVLAHYTEQDAALYVSFQGMGREAAGRFLRESYLPLFPEEVRTGRDFQDSMGGDLRNIGQEAILEARPWGFDLAQIRCPVVLAHGTADTEVPYMAMEETAKYLPHAKIIPMEGEEHASPATTARLLEELLGSL